MWDSWGEAVAISWKQYISADPVYPTQKRFVGSFFCQHLWGWADVRGGIEGRVHSQTASAGSGLMDNIPLDHKLLPPRHDWYSSWVHSSFRSRELTNTIVTAMCGKKKAVPLRSLGCL